MAGQSHGPPQVEEAMATAGSARPSGPSARAPGQRRGIDPKRETAVSILAMARAAAIHQISLGANPEDELTK